MKLLVLVALALSSHLISVTASDDLDTCVQIALPSLKRIPIPRLMKTTVDTNRQLTGGKSKTDFHAAVDKLQSQQLASLIEDSQHFLEKQADITDQYPCMDDVWAHEFAGTKHFPVLQEYIECTMLSYYLSSI